MKDEDLEFCKNIELTKNSLFYLKKIFECHKSKLTNKIDEGALEKIFATTEKGVPWKVKLET